MAMAWSDKPEIVALNKIDAIPKAELAKKRAALEKACGTRCIAISGVSGAGVDRRAARAGQGDSTTARAERRHRPLSRKTVKPKPSGNKKEAWAP